MTTRFFSKLLNENGTITDDKSVIFDSGMTFSEAELRVIRKESRETIQALCLVKSVFGGDLEYCGKMGEVFIPPSKMVVVHKEVVEPVKTAVRILDKKDSEQLTFEMLMR